MRPIYIHGSAALTAQTGLNGQEPPSLADGDPFFPSFALADFNPRDVIPMMKLRRMDRASRMLICVLDRLLPKDRDVTDWGLFIGTFSAGSDAVEQFLTRYFDEGPLGANPMVFPNTVLNAAAGQAAIYYGLKGPNSTQCMNFLAGAAALQAACHYLQFNKTTLLAGAVDVLSPFQFEVWKSHPSYGVDSFLVGEGAVVLWLSRDLSAIRIEGFSQGRLPTQPYHFANADTDLDEAYKGHVAKYGVPDVAYLFGYGLSELQAQETMVNRVAQVNVRALGRAVGVSSMMPLAACHAAVESLLVNQSADVLAFGIGGDFLFTRIARVTA